MADDPNIVRRIVRRRMLRRIRRRQRARAERRLRRIRNRIARRSELDIQKGCCAQLYRMRDFCQNGTPGTKFGI